MVALITGIAGQDGSYLAELLLEHDYEVHGLVTEEDQRNLRNLDGVLSDVRLHEGDVRDDSCLTRLAHKTCAEEVYHMAALSSVELSWRQPMMAAEVTGMGAARVLEVFAHQAGARVFQPSSAEMYGRQAGRIDEETRVHPDNPYGCAKAFAHCLARSYRVGLGTYAVGGILFNHESPRRPQRFLSRKIARGVAAVCDGRQECLDLGNLDATGDWGYARDYAYGMWLTLQQPEADEYVFATGSCHSVREFVEAAFSVFDRPIEWRGLGFEEQGIDTMTGRIVVRVNPEFFRPLDRPRSWGDSSKARSILGWRPTVDFESLVQLMVEAELEAGHA